MNTRRFYARLVPIVGCLLVCGCASRVPREQRLGPPYDRPFPLGQVSDSHWETQQTNAEAADFIFYDHEFVGDTARLTHGAEKHLLQVAVRLEHVPFPVVVEESADGRSPRLDAQRRQTIVDRLAHLGLPAAEPRVVVAPVFCEGLSAVEGEAAYYSTMDEGGFGLGGGAGRGFSGRGGAYR